MGRDDAANDLVFGENALNILDIGLGAKIFENTSAVQEKLSSSQRFFSPLNDAPLRVCCFSDGRIERI